MTPAHLHGDDDPGEISLADAIAHVLGAHEPPSGRPRHAREAALPSRAAEGGRAPSREGLRGRVRRLLGLDG